MGFGEGAKSRREFVRALLLNVVTLQESLCRPVTKREAVEKTLRKGDFDDETTKMMLRKISSDGRSPLDRKRADGNWLYAVDRPEEVDDYVAGMKEDGIDPADL